MNGFSDLDATLQGMGFRQLLPAFTACIAYAVAQGRLASPRVRRWSWAVVALSAVLFSALCRPWEHGVVLVAFGLAGLGLFTGLVWLISTLIGVRGAAPVAASILPGATTATPSDDDPRPTLPIPIHGAPQ